MKSLSSLFIAAAIIAAGHAAPASAEPTRVVPLTPAQLLAALPKPTSGWTLQKSQGETSLARWVESRARRTYVPPVDPKTGLAAGLVELRLKDTGGFRPALHAFKDFKPEKSGDEEKLYLNGQPAVVTRDSDEPGSVQARVLLAGRFVLEITTTGRPEERLEAWVNQVDAAQLGRLPVVKAETLPASVQIVHVDELQPGRSRSYTATTTNAVALKKMLEELPENKNPLPEEEPSETAASSPAKTP